MLRKVFQKIREAGLKLSPKKCRFFKREIKCLGHVVYAEGISWDPSKRAAVSTWQHALSRRPVEVHCSSVNVLLNQGDFTEECLIINADQSGTATGLPIVSLDVKWSEEQLKDPVLNEVIPSPCLMASVLNRKGLLHGQDRKEAYKG